MSGQGEAWWLCKSLQEPGLVLHPEHFFIVRFVRYRQGGTLYKINLLATKVIAAQLASHILCQALLRLTQCTLN